MLLSRKLLNNPASAEPDLPIALADWTEDQEMDATEVDWGPRGITWKPDGTKFWLVNARGRTSSQSGWTYTYTCSTAWDISTHSYVSGEFADLTPGMMAFLISSDGDTIFRIEHDLISKHSLSTSWNVSTFGSATQTLSTSTYSTGNRDAFFSSDGTKLFTCGASADTIESWTLSTGFDLSTASHTATFDASGDDSRPSGIALNDDGTRLWYTNASSIYEKSMSTAYDLSTLSAVDDRNPANAGTLGSIVFKPDFTKAWICDFSADTLNELGTS